LMLVVGLEDQLHVDLQRVVAADPRRAAAAGQHSALELRSIEAAGIKIEDASAAIGRIAETGHLNFEGDREQKLGVDLRHGDPPMKMTGIRHFIEVNVMELTVSAPVLVRK
jgi:hypothetical protein